MKSGECLGFSDYAQATHRRGGKVIGYSESPREGTSAGFDISADGDLVRSVAGKAPQNEDRALLTSQILVRRLNQLGNSWSHPKRNEEKVSDIDCLAKASDGEDVLKIQVVRADPSECFWAELSHKGASGSAYTVSDAVRAIRQAIRKKEKIPPDRRTEIMLALDATVTPDLIHSDVIEATRSSIGAEIRGLGFLGVYLVGPEVQHVHRLDG